MIFIYLGCFLLLLYYLYTRNYNYWASKGIPYEKPFFIFGSMYNVMTRKQHIHHRIREIYENSKSPYIGIYIFNQPNLVVRSPELLKKILVKDFDKFTNRPIALNETADPITAHSMFSAHDQTWRDVRSKVSPVFTSGKMKLMLPLMKECANDLVSYLEKRNGEVVEFRNLMKKYAVDIISSCAFGINSYCLKNENSEILDVATKLLDPKSFVRTFSFFCYFFAHKLVDIFRLKFLEPESVDYLMKVFSATTAERKKRNILRNDLIDLLNHLKDADIAVGGGKFDDLTMASQAITFFSAGNDTTSLTISFALYELALNQELQTRLRQEITETFKKYGDFTYEAIQEMKYLDMVFNESSRKYPLTAFLNRKASTKYTFEGTDLTIDKDVAILIPVAGLHFDPEYFPNPDTFDPERFSEENKHKIVPYTYLPFGDGPRNCIGQRFALLVGKIGLAYAVKNFIFEKTKATSVPVEFDPSSFFMLSKTGIQLKVTKV